MAFVPYVYYVLLLNSWKLTIYEFARFLSNIDTDLLYQKWKTSEKGSKLEFLKRSPIKTDSPDFISIHDITHKHRPSLRFYPCVNPPPTPQNIPLELHQQLSTFSTHLQHVNCSIIDQYLGWLVTHSIVSIRMIFGSLGESLLMVLGIRNQKYYN